MTVVFEDGTDIYFARQLVGERLREAASRLPAGVEPELGPIATGLGEIFMFTVERRSADADVDADRAAHDPGLGRSSRSSARVPGVTEVNTHRRLREGSPRHAAAGAAARATASASRDLLGALARNNANVGAGYIERNGEQYLVRVAGPGRDARRHAADRRRPRATASRSAVRDVADVRLGEELRTGAATENGGEVVLGTVFMLIGENSRAVSQRVAAKLAEINRTLPDGRRRAHGLRPHRARRSHDRDGASATSSRARCW